MNPDLDDVNVKDVINGDFQRNVKMINGVVNNGIDYFRDVLREVNQTSVFGSCKVIIIDEVHGLSSAAKNALLTPLEDKDSDVFFFMTTSEPHLLSDMIKDRTLMWDLKKLNELEISKKLLSVIGNSRVPEEFKTEGIYEIAVQSQGSLRKAISLYEKVTLIKDYSIETIQSLSDVSFSIDILNALQKLCEGKYLVFIHCIVDLLRQDRESFHKQFVATMNNIYRVVNSIPLKSSYYEKMIDSKIGKYKRKFIGYNIFHHYYNFLMRCDIRDPNVYDAYVNKFLVSVKESIQGTK
jgi:DNA polymerase III gamma/tau subunit